MLSDRGCSNRQSAMYLLVRDNKSPLKGGMGESAIPDWSLLSSVKPDLVGCRLAALMLSLTPSYRTQLLPVVYHHTRHTVVSSCLPPQHGCAVSFEAWLPSSCLYACNFDLDTYKGPFLSDGLEWGTRSIRCWCGRTLGGA